MRNDYEVAMKWKKEGLVFNANNNNRLMVSHAQIPTPFYLGNSIYRIYFSSRDSKGKTYPYFLDWCFDSKQIEFVREEPLFFHGKIGLFDDSGIMPASVIKIDNKVYMYYIAWNPQVTVSYRLSIGLAISLDNGHSFEKFSQGPLLDRGIDEPYFNTAPCVIEDGGLYRMWYVSCTGWKVVNIKTEPVYLIRYAESTDGIEWKKKLNPVIDYKFDGEAIGRPYVVKCHDDYKMWYSVRGSNNYRSKEGEHYKIGFASSNDGIEWERKDNFAGIGTSEYGWDSEMIEYCSVCNREGTFIMFYNGNSFGKTGFGYAISK